jgi:hypothetical protein
MRMRNDEERAESAARFEEFFSAATGLPRPYDWQTQVAADGIPDVLSVPTGLGKTEVALAWAWRFARRQAERTATPRGVPADAQSRHAGSAAPEKVPGAHSQSQGDLPDSSGLADLVRARNPSVLYSSCQDEDKAFAMLRGERA